MAFRPAARYLETQARQARNSALLLSGFWLIAYLIQLLTALGNAHAQQRPANPLFTGLVWFVLLIGPIIGARQTQRRNSRGRIALGRDGILLLPPVMGATLSRRQVIPWGDVAAIGPSMGCFGPSRKASSCGQGARC